MAKYALIVTDLFLTGLWLNRRRNTNKIKKNLKYALLFEHLAE
jgi:hypothetical protein